MFNSNNKSCLILEVLIFVVSPPSGLPSGDLDDERPQRRRIGLARILEEHVITGKEQIGFTT